MAVTVERTSIRGTTPWAQATRPKSGDYDRHGSLHYRGWTLVDIGRTRFASNDVTGVRRRVCHENASMAEALSEFRAVVDKMEGKEC